MWSSYLRSIGRVMVQIRSIGYYCVNTRLLLDDGCLLLVVSFESIEV